MTGIGNKKALLAVHKSGCLKMIINRYLVICLFTFHIAAAAAAAVPLQPKMFQQPVPFMKARFARKPSQLHCLH